MSNKFFKIIEQYIQPELPDSIINFLSDNRSLKNAFQLIDVRFTDSYIYQIFINWLSRFVKSEPNYLRKYFIAQENLDFICTKFINFCFAHKIELNLNKTLASFKEHNQLSDNAIKQELKKITKRKDINLLGFGLDDGSYEKQLAKFLIEEGYSNITIYGMDPYAKKGADIRYLTPEQFIELNDLKFDIIIARWSLHHVLQNRRWSNLINCMNQCNPNALILFIEHGFLNKRRTFIRKKIYYLLNAIFDIVANIGLRPRYFTETSPNFGTNFFIRYLDFNDYIHITKALSCNIYSKNIYDIGPIFPNQTIFSFHVLDK